MSAVNSKRLAKLTIDTIAGIRNEECVNAMYDVAVKESKNIPFVEEPVLKRKRKAPKYSFINFVERYSSASPAQLSFIVFEKLESLLIKALKEENRPQK